MLLDRRCVDRDDGVVPEGLRGFGIQAVIPLLMSYRMVYHDGSRDTRLLVPQSIQASSTFLTHLPCV